MPARRRRGRGAAGRHPGSSGSSSASGRGRRAGSRTRPHGGRSDGWPALPTAAGPRGTSATDGRRAILTAAGPPGASAADGRRAILTAAGPPGASAADGRTRAGRHSRARHGNARRGTASRAATRQRRSCRSGSAHRCPASRGRRSPRRDDDARRGPAATSGRPFGRAGRGRAALRTTHETNTGARPARVPRRAAARSALPSPGEAERPALRGSRRRRVRRAERALGPKPPARCRRHHPRQRPRDRGGGRPAADRAVGMARGQLRRRARVGQRSLPDRGARAHPLALGTLLRHRATFHTATFTPLTTPAGFAGC